jgi:demethylmenaquinone methyltransferase / 2-methoxy-6-polyprenyl-1,4-benzoquinol methylase
MKSPAERQNSRLMRQMFGTIAPTYDFISRVFSLGMDRRWKRLGVSEAALSENALVLDLACGTGDFSQLVIERLPRATAIAADITEAMLRLAHVRGVKNAVCGDASSLPFACNSFDCVFIGYGLRNFPDLKAAVREIQRVTRTGGLIVSLDFFLPSNAVLREIYLAYLYAQGAIWGLLLHGRARVYTYIPDSLRSFLTIRDFSALLNESGYGQVATRSYILGGIGLHWAVKKQVERERQSD